jgi:hypothetical protein
MRASGSGHLQDDTIDEAFAEQLDITRFHSVSSFGSTIK